MWLSCFPTCSLACPFQDLLESTWATLPVSHQLSSGPSKSMDWPGMVCIETTKVGGGREMHTSHPSQGPFPTWPGYFFIHPRATPLGGVRTQPRANSLSIRPQGCRNTNGYIRVPAIGHQGRGLVREWSDWTILPFLQCHLNPRATFHLGACQLNCPEHLHNGPQSGVVEGKSRRAEPAQATGDFWEFAPAAVVIW